MAGRSQQLEQKGADHVTLQPQSGAGEVMHTMNQCMQALNLFFIFDTIGDPHTGHSPAQINTVFSH